MRNDQVGDFSRQFWPLFAKTDCQNDVSGRFWPKTQDSRTPSQQWPPFQQTTLPAFFSELRVWTDVVLWGVATRRSFWPDPLHFTIVKSTGSRQNDPLVESRENTTAAKLAASSHRDKRRAEDSIRAGGSRWAKQRCFQKR